jgi:hypothetical protein
MATDGSGMPLSIAAALLSVLLAAVGLLAVYIEVTNVRCAAEVRRLLEREEECVERVRELQLRYHAEVNPDLLERELPSEFRDEADFPLRREANSLVLREDS